MTADPLFRSFFLGGFECSTHKVRGGRRLDMVAATRHDQFFAEDYSRLVTQGIRAAREGLRWHLIEPELGRLDFAGIRPMIRAARDRGVQVIWDLFHYGWPDDLDIFGPDFVPRFARMARGFAEVWAAEAVGAPLWVAPVNEISFLSHVGGQVGAINPFTKGRGFELKCQLVRASIAATDAVWSVVPDARIAQIDPIFHVIPHPDRPGEAIAAEAYRTAQYQAWDMLGGRLWPELGGHPRYLDVIGVNYYPWNQWIYNGELEDGITIEPDHPKYRPFRDMLAEHQARYGRPMFVAEIGSEGDGRAEWLARVGHEVCAAIEHGVDVQGICLYPIVDFPGWENDRHCHNGLWDYVDDRGHRPICGPYAAELDRQSERIVEVRRRSRPGGPS